ncbi:MAG: ABC transporter ATP-binding protein [Lachnospiraceae bacterium]|nr:ABC transporter ATP-binding protein [Lachnospiraceae bacterium]
MSNLVEISQVEKGYGIKKKVFTNLNLNLESGKIIGLLGPNGSGKTTLIKMLAGLLKQDSGEIMIDGHKVGPETKAIVSYLPERTYFNESLKIKNLVNMFKDFYKDFDEERAYQMMGLLKIDPEMVFKKLSKGNKEKVQLIMVMSRRAKLYLLDEPIAGVDPAARDYILQTIISNYDTEGTILISTHLIQDIENILDDVVFIKEGEIVCHQNADALRNERGQSIDEIFREVFRC